MTITLGIPSTRWDLSILKMISKRDCSREDIQIIEFFSKSYLKRHGKSHMTIRKQATDLNYITFWLQCNRALEKRQLF